MCSVARGGSEIGRALARVGADPREGDLEYLLSARGAGGEIFECADAVRARFMGGGILARGIIEFSNFCDKTCAYCGLNRAAGPRVRYRMTRDEIMAAVGRIASCGIATVVLQSGDDYGFSAEWLGGIVGEIQSRGGMAVTLSVGERRRREYAAWRRAGADRYLLKMETSDRALYEALHPGMRYDNRLRCLDDLRDLGYQVGSGIIVGLKGQTTRSIARDILFLRRRAFDMIGIGPFIPHGGTALSAQGAGSPSLALRALALTRIATGNAHLPATTALGSLARDYRPAALRAGANVLMPNFTPHPYRGRYDIYPGRKGLSGAPDGGLERMARAAGRFIDYSRGDSLKQGARHA